MAHPDVASEQAYLDHAYDCLDRMRDVLVRAGDAVVDHGLRELYVALTRPTRTLVVVHARPLPAGLAQREQTR